MRQYLVHRVIVNTAESSFDALLWDIDDQVVVLRNATIHAPGRDPTPVIGDVVVLRSAIRWMQMPGEFP